MSVKFIFSLVINIILIFIIIVFISKKGGLEYLKDKIFQRKKNMNTLFRENKQSIFEVMPNNENSIVFLGNSLTAFCDWSELLENSKIVNRGISGDLLDDVIDRVEPILNLKPKKIFLMIGVNDLAKSRKVRQILVDYEKLLNIIKDISPESKIYLQSILPTKNKEKMKNKDIIFLNEGIYNLSKKYNTTYINIFDAFKTNSNELNMIYSFDGLHLNGKGYLLWKKNIENYVKN